MATCYLMPALLFLKNIEMIGLLHVFLQTGLHQKLPHRVWYLLSPKLLDSGQPLTGLWNGKVRVLSILILNTTVEMEYRAIREKIHVQGHDLLHFSIQWALTNVFLLGETLEHLQSPKTLSFCQGKILSLILSFTSWVQHIEADTQGTPELRHWFSVSLQSKGHFNRKSLWTFLSHISLVTTK